MCRVTLNIPTEPLCHRRSSALRFGFIYDFWSYLTLQSNGPLYSNTVIGTLAVEGWAVTFGTTRRGLGGLGPLLAVPNVTVHPSTASVPT